MEPRIATLLGDSSLERTLLEPVSLLPPPSVAPRRPHPVEPSPVSDDSRPNVNARRSEFLGNNDSYTASRGQGVQVQNSQNSRVPIAGVLNDETPAPTGPQPLPALSTASVTPFSGRLSDILLDPSQQPPNKRRRLDGQTTPPALTGPENTLLKLPQPRQLPKKTSKRPRIPPLLQGLHQPPPLPPEGTRFPPITGEAGGFGRDIGDRVGLRSPVGPERSKEKDAGDSPGTVPSGNTVEEGKEKENPVDMPTSTSGSDKENRNQNEAERATTEPSKAKELKRRNKWSEQETKDLLVGVSRFGIGNWKKILQCSDFNFNHRTAVDLKDRFRTCCPGEGLKLRKRKCKNNSQDAASEGPNAATASSSASNSQNVTDPEISKAESTSKDSGLRKTRGESHRKGPVELAEMGIHGPFIKNNRRERREFTQKDDESLLKGFEKYGASWHSMRDDKDLGFSTRHPTDLRDRFRIRYPEMYAKAGYKLKPKDERMLKEKEEKEKETSNTQETAISTNTIEAPEAQKANEETTNIDPAFTNITTSAPSNTDLKAHTLRQPLLNSFPSPLEDFGDIPSEEDGSSSRSPIVLNRNIFQWADANPSQAVAAATQSSFPTVTSMAADPSLNMFAGMDGMHINPLATLKLPMTLMTSNVLSATPSSFQQSSNSLMLTLPVTQPSANTTSTPASSGPTTTPSNPSASSASKQSMNPLLRTPNLPTIVFPHVPAASARSAVHNLPPPADLLSGLDLDVRQDSQAAGFMLDDSLGFALPSNQGGYSSTFTFPPTIGGPNGRGLLLEEGYWRRGEGWVACDKGQR
ncbi:hypothetical protein BU26DRAFT_498002 [Trematosphaeria pertusa]|uniref:Myb-like domain-containing protein n=1 Tax=Trematosphaeria pertusa TaxID=390896 RepID=A0A6A6HRA2_9PLEO|nr:uncharacterized protein BU26DRAFT_498002 [Trematosphaeria pertusa]KAF2240399.1 hypothetical protein BU26DRAFT_498002 [Trematosphaeria pertusa]